MTPESGWPWIKDPAHPTAEEAARLTSVKGTPKLEDLIPGADSRKMAKTALKFVRKMHPKKNVKVRRKKHDS